jgi:hypothetical protein
MISKKLPYPLPPALRAVTEASLDSVVQAAEVVADLPNAEAWQAITSWCRQRLGECGPEQQPLLDAIWDMRRELCAERKEAAQQERQQQNELRQKQATEQLQQERRTARAERQQRQQAAATAFLQRCAERGARMEAAMEQAAQERLAAYHRSPSSPSRASARASARHTREAKDSAVDPGPENYPQRKH